MRKSLDFDFTETGKGLWLKIRGDITDYALGLYYVPCESSRHWDKNLFDEIQEDIACLKRQSSHILLMGDFNARRGKLDDYVELDEGVSEVPRRSNRDEKVNTNGRMLIDLRKTTDMSLLNGRTGKDEGIGEFTCITHNGKSTIDYFMIDSPGAPLVQDFEVLEFDRCLYDVHCPVKINLVNPVKDINDPKSLSKRKLIKKWNNDIKSKYQQELDLEKLARVRAPTNTILPDAEVINHLNTTLRNAIQESAVKSGSLEFHVPRSTQIKTRQKPWFDHSCRYERSVYRKRVRQAKRQENEAERKSALRIYRQFLRSKKTAHDQKLNSNLQNAKVQDPKKYWALLKSMTRSENTLGASAEAFFEHFKKLNSRESTNETDIGSQSESTTPNEGLNEPFCFEEIKKCINKLKCGKSAGLDNIFPEFLKYAPDTLLYTLVEFLNKILEAGVVPDKWAISYYCPIFKKGNVKDPSNYRGISIASCLCKLFTALLAERIFSDLHRRLILGAEQAGFRKNSSCLDHAFVLYSIVSFYLAQNRRFFVTFIDYEKAFDRVNHSILWQKLAAIDVNGNVLRVIRNLYEKTKACVRVNGVYTNVFDCGIGVRQGDSLSPLLFIIFLNDFKNYIRNQFAGANLSTLILYSSLKVREIRRKRLMQQSGIVN